MELPVNPSQLIDLLRAWFFAKDRSIVLANDTFIQLPEIATPDIPSGDNHRFYPKSDDFWYELASGGTEELLFGWSLINEITLSADATSVTFSSIPQVFRNLVIFAQIRSDRAAELDTPGLRFNSDSGNNYDTIQATFNTAFGVSATVTRATSSIIAGICEAANSRASNFGSNIIWILGYTESKEKKSIILGETEGDVSADTDLSMRFTSGRWRDTSAITSITLFPRNGTNFVDGTKLQLYGVK